MTIIGCDNGVANNKGITDTSGTTLVCFGDSLTAGFGATVSGADDKTKSYPAYLQSKVNMPVINAGLSGDASSGALKRINSDVLSKNPRIVIIELGANDPFWLIPLSETARNLQSIIDSLNDGNRKIYIAKFYTEAIAREMANNVGITDYAVQTRIVAQYDTMYKSLVSKNKIELIDDIWDGVWGIHMSDTVHPNAAGYEIMADNYLNAMKPYLQTNNLLK
jgi:acyl-CoA thioesterase-1